MARKRAKTAYGPFFYPSGYHPSQGLARRTYEPLDHPARPSTRLDSTLYLMRTVQMTPARDRPSPLARARSIHRVSSPYRYRFRVLSLDKPAVLPERAFVCARRQVRKEVLFALRQTGKGARSPRSPRSKVSC